MFEITPEDILALSDEDLRELIGLLCEAVMRSRGLPTSAVTYSGNQTAKDGGVDVRVRLPAATVIDGFVPRPSTGYQAKKTSYSAAGIEKEMKPKGALRDVIKTLAEEKGAYIIASSGASVSETAYDARILAMSNAVKDLPNAADLHFDFYDRKRLATWVRDHGGVILWVRSKAGKAVKGWHPYGPWAHTADGKDAVYLLDDKLRVQTGQAEDVGGLNPLDGLNRIRSVLQQTGKVVRIVGLSGVGKTRFVQALFDERLGAHALDPALAIYANSADEPEPTPLTLASDLIASRTKAILIIDNCTPDLHRKLSDVCRQAGGTIAVLTIEYDIRDDKTEGTEFFSLEPSSDELITKFIRQRYSDISPVDAQTIATFSGGNARIAVALASTLDKNESLAGMSDHDLFKQLFEQRHGNDGELLKSAKACSLVYSFDGEDVSSNDSAELNRLGACVQQNAATIYASVGELLRRELVQQRSIWRAVLPHAIANRLAKLALADTPYAVLDAQLIQGGVSERLRRSFSRRLGYLHESPHAVAIVKKWLLPGGLLYDVANLDEGQRAMLKNVLPLVPDQALEVFEAAAKLTVPGQSHTLEKYSRLIRSLAWEATNFERCATLLVGIAKADPRAGTNDDATSAFKSLFQLYYSGTHAAIDQRVAFADRLLRSANDKERTLGELALHGLLITSHFSSYFDADFGARPRDYGFWPKTTDQMDEWYKKALGLAVVIGNSALPSADRARLEVGNAIRGMWRGKTLRPILREAIRALHAFKYFREGWVGLRRTLKYDLVKGSPEAAELVALEKELRPVGIEQRVRAIVLSGSASTLDFDDEDDDEEEGDEDGIPEKRPDRAQIVFELGRELNAAPEAYQRLLPDLVQAGGRMAEFGRGLVTDANDPMFYWTGLTAAYLQTPKEDRSEFILRGALQGIAAKEPQIAQNILDNLLDEPELANLLPIMQMMIGLDGKGVVRMRRGLEQGVVAVGQLQYLALGGTTKNTPAKELADLIVEISKNSEWGQSTAIEILHMRMFGDLSDKKPIAEELLAAGRVVLSDLDFDSRRERDDYALAQIAIQSLRGAQGAAIAQNLCGRLRDAIIAYTVYPSSFDDLLRAITKVQPTALLDGLMGGSPKDGARILDALRLHDVNLLAHIPEDALLVWCNAQPDRFLAAASAIQAFEGDDEEGAKHWTPLAMRLLNEAPDRISVLSVLVNRLHPRSWSGSRAAILEKNTLLLDPLFDHPDAKVAALVREAKSRLTEEANAERQREQDESRHRDDRFEW